MTEATTVTTRSHFLEGQRCAAELGGQRITPPAQLHRHALAALDEDHFALTELPALHATFSWFHEGDGPGDWTYQGLALRTARIMAGPITI